MPFRFPLFLPKIVPTIARPLAGLVVCAVVAACSSETPPVAPGPGAAAWRWVAPASEGATLTDVWGPTATDLFASGTGGIVLRFDGSVWQKTSTPSTENLNAIWGSSGTNVVAVGDAGTIVRYDGTSWKPQTSGTAYFLLDVWGSAENDVFAVGGKRTILHFDGALWSPMTVPAGAQALTSVWGSGPSDVYVTGLGKNLLHYDGIAWSEIVTTATFALYSVWGAGPSDVFVVGGNGAAVYFDGSIWTPIDVGAPLFMSTVWGTGPDDVYTSGQGGLTYRWDGDVWNPTETVNSETMNRVFGVDGRLFAVGDYGTALELEGNVWTHMSGALTVDFDDVWVSPRGEAFVVGDRGTILHFQDGVWESMPSGTSNRLRAIHGVAWNDAFAVGENGTVLHFDGASWTPDVAGPGLRLSDVWMLSSTDAFAVGDAGLILRLQGGTWMDYSIATITDALFGVWGETADNVYIVGEQSRALKWNGVQWKLVTIDPANIHTFHGVFGTAGNDVYVATEYFRPAAVASGAAAADGALHAGGYIFHWNGISWQPVYQDPGHDILALWAPSPNRAFACGDASSILLGSDAGWARVFDLQNLPFYIKSVWGASADDVFVVGDNGTIARYSR